MKRGFFRNQDGAAAIEFGLIVPVLAMLLGGTIVTGGMVLAYNTMRQAVSSGAQYALTVSEDTAEIEDVVDAAWQNKPDSGHVAVAQACYCGTTVTDCSTNCADGDYPQRLTTITASQSYENIMGTITPISASQTVRTR
ncbi:MAG TPA: TadE/TadG family type IV pilus assembly protein [Caulobacteraceae bacterium]